MAWLPIVFFQGFGILAVLILGLLGFALLAFEIWMFIDLVQNPRLTAGAKLLWAIGMLLLHPFVAIIYFFTARSKAPLRPA